MPRCMKFKSMILASWSGSNPVPVGRGATTRRRVNTRRRRYDCQVARLPDQRSAVASNQRYTVGAGYHMHERLANTRRGESWRPRQCFVQPRTVLRIIDPDLGAPEDPP